MLKSWAFLRKSFLEMSSYKLAFILQFLGIFLSIVTYFFLAKIVPSRFLEEYGGSYFAFVLIGVAFMSFLGLSLEGFTRFIRESQMSGTLESMLVTPTKLPTILLNSLLWGFVIVSIQAVLYLTFGVLFFGLDLNINLVSAVVIFALSIFVFGAIGILGAGMIMIFKRGDPLTWVFTSLSGILGGAIFPITVLPLWLQKISYLVPLSYSLRAFRHAVLNGASLASLSFDVMGLVIFAFILFPLSLFVFKHAVRKAKKDGSLVKF